jgi:hypothetical protein
MRKYLVIVSLVAFFSTLAVIIADAQNAEEITGAVDDEMDNYLGV